MAHERFHFTSAEALYAKAKALGLDLPMTEDISALARSVAIGKALASNAMALQPMEGCDGTPDGSPDELTYRRYQRFMQGGAGLVWFEATAVVPEGRANPRQLHITQANAGSFANLLESSLAAGRKVNGAAYRPYTVLQLTHSGRYSRPGEHAAPIIAHHDGVLDKVFQISPDYPLISDEQLQALISRYVAAARLAQQCGFDAVDIKCCHRYLLNELLAAHTRPGRYGGSFENRTRLLLEIVEQVRSACPHLAVWVRLNCYDGHPFPWGWGVDRQNPGQLDIQEPLRLMDLLQRSGVTGVNVTAGNPYFTPHINRPYDQVVQGGKLPEEHPLVGVARLLDLARQVKQANPKLLVIGSGFSWLRQFLGQVAAAAVQRGWIDLAGIGRGAFAYPDQVRDLLTTGRIDSHKACITCSRCTQIMRDHGRTGCVIFDHEIYGPIYKAGLVHRLTPKQGQA